MIINVVEATGPRTKHCGFLWVFTKVV